MEKKKKHLDFVIQDNLSSKLIFRFYPRLSSCHGFGDELPKTWEEVYKVYFHYKILYVPTYNPQHARVQWDSMCDECSIIGDVGHVCRLLAQGIEKIENEVTSIKLLNHEIIPFGDGVAWEIRKNGTYCIQMYNSCDQGYRVFLDKEKLAAFGQYLEDCCKYMLKHSNPI